MSVLYLYITALCFGMKRCFEFKVIVQAAVVLQEV